MPRMPLEEPFVQRVPADAVVDLRRRLLRANRPAADSVYPGDSEPTTLHFGIYDPSGQTLVACGTFLRNDFRDEPAWRLRGMAVDPTLQRSGFGGRILSEAGCVIAQAGHSKLLWCYARVPAIGFYERNGWTVVSEQIDFPDVGPHVEMIKRL